MLLLYIYISTTYYNFIYSSTKETHGAIKDNTQNTAYFKNYQLTTEYTWLELHMSAAPKWMSSIA